MSDLIKIVSSVDQFSKAREPRLILSGELVLCSLRPLTDVPGFVRQPPLMIRRGLFGIGARESQKIHTAIKSELLERPDQKVGLAVEGYIKWGMAQNAKGVTILIGGGASAEAYNLLICVFNAGRVAALEERIMPPREHPDWEESVKILLAALIERHPSANIFLAAPLAPWEDTRVTPLGREALKGVSFTKPRRSVRDSDSPLAALGLLAMGACLYAGATAYGYYRYQTAVDEYRIAASQPLIVSQGGINNAALNLLSKRESYMKQDRRLLRLNREAELLASRLSGFSDMRLVELRFPAPAPRNAAEAPADLLISFSVPASRSSRIEQAKEVMTRIAERTGLTLRMVPSTDPDGSNVRLFKMEAILPAAAAAGRAP